MTTQNGTLSIKFKKNPRGNLQQKKCLINKKYDFKKIPEDQVSMALLEKIASVIEEKTQTWAVEFELSGQEVLRLRE